MSHAMPSVLTPLLARFSTFALAVAMFTPSASRGQCPTPPCPSGCTTVCEVTTQAELVAALCCHAAAGTCCSHIRIPGNVTLVLTSTINLTAAYAGLHLEIAGIISWEGGAHADNVMFGISGTEMQPNVDLLIDGGGTVTSIYDPANYNCGYPCGIAKVFSITGHPKNVDIHDLTVVDLGSVLEVQQGSVVTNLNVVNVHADNLVRYGFFIDDRAQASFQNCSVKTTWREPPFRLYSRSSGLAVDNCWSYASIKTGLWLPEGNNVTVDRFSSDKWLRFGPDQSFGDADTLTNVFARELHGTDELVPTVQPLPLLVAAAVRASGLNSVCRGCAW